MITKRHFISIITLFLISLQLSAQPKSYQKTVFINYLPQKDTTALHFGIDLLAENDFKLLKNKKIAVICNDGSLDRDGIHLLDVINDREDFELVSIIQISDELFKTESSGKVLILADKLRYVKNITLTPDNFEIELSDLNEADLILMDIQNLGIRYDFNVHVLIMFMQMSADVGIPLLILDRLNPLTANISEGPLAGVPGLDNGVKLPWRYGLTLGELAFMINEERWLPTIVQTPLSVIPMVNYDRTKWMDQTGYFWRIPLKEIPSIDKLLTYCSTFFYDYTNVSNGQGSPFLFEVGGAPWISGPIMTIMLNRHDKENVEYSLVQFTPGDFSEVISKMEYSGQECTGIRLNVLKRDKYLTSTVGSNLLGVIAQMYPKHFRWKNPEEIDRLFGDDSFRTIVDAGLNLDQLYPVWTSNLTNFQKLRQKYLLYPDK